MSDLQSPIWKILAVVSALVLLALVPLGLNRLARRNSANSFPVAPMRDNAMRTPAPTSLPSGDEAAVLAHPTPPVPARSDDLYEDVTDRAGLKFVNQYCDRRIANILESNGAGGAVLDFDNDGLPDIYLVNNGPLDGVTHHKPGTPREPNRLYRNRGDGTFEDVTE